MSIYNLFRKVSTIIYDRKSTFFALPLHHALVDSTPFATFLHCLVLYSYRTYLLIEANFPGKADLAFMYICTMWHIM
jgi:hypothetical protein